MFLAALEKIVVQSRSVSIAKYIDTSSVAVVGIELQKQRAFELPCNIKVELHQDILGNQLSMSGR